MESNLGKRSTTARRLSPHSKIAGDYTEVYRMGAVERIDLINNGAPPEMLTAIAKSMHRSKESFVRLIGMSATTANRRLSKDEPFSTNDSERLVATAKLIGQVQSMVQESGDATGFDAAQWFNQWLERRLPALNNRRPAEFMTTAEGRQLLSTLLASAQSGAYA